MRLLDLDPHWTGGTYGGPSRRGTGLTFRCPHCQTRLGVMFMNPIDGGPRMDGYKYYWHRTGDTFDTLTLSPSVNAEPQGHWHGFIHGGEVT